MNSLACRGWAVTPHKERRSLGGLRTFRAELADLRGRLGYAGRFVHDPVPLCSLEDSR